jgi:hypothetical protein
LLVVVCCWANNSGGGTNTVYTEKTKAAMGII